MNRMNALQNDLENVFNQRLAELPFELNIASRKLLLQYIALLQKWNRVYNLTAVRDAPQMLTLHVLDSLAVVPIFARRLPIRHILDVGAGGGLPGIVLAIWAAAYSPGTIVSLVDTVQKKTAFLRQVKAELQLDNVRVISGRVENIEIEGGCDIITSRAFAELKDFVSWSAHLLSKQGCFLAMKGQYPQQEMDNLPPGWRVTCSDALTVPGLDAERHMVTIEREAACDD